MSSNSSIPSPSFASQQQQQTNVPPSPSSSSQGSSTANFSTTPTSPPTNPQYPLQSKTAYNVLTIPSLDNNNSQLNNADSQSVVTTNSSTGNTSVVTEAEALFLGVQALERQQAELELRRAKTNATVRRSTNSVSARRANPFENMSPGAQQQQEQITRQAPYYHGVHAQQQQQQQQQQHPQDHPIGYSGSGDVPSTVHLKQESQLSEDVQPGGEKLRRINSFGKFLKSPATNKKLSASDRKEVTKITAPSSPTRTVSAPQLSTFAANDNRGYSVQSPFSYFKPLLYGYLHKLGRHGKWQRRWFETDGETLLYFKSKSRNKLLATLDLLHVGVISMDWTAPNGNTFTIEVAGRIYYLCADSKESACDWVITLNRVKEARMQIGGLKLIHPNLDNGKSSMMEEYSNSVSGAAGAGGGEVEGRRERSSGSDDYGARVVMVATRQRTKGLGKGDFGDDLKEMMDHSVENDDTIGTTNFAWTMSPVSATSESHSTTVTRPTGYSSVVSPKSTTFNRWTKKRSPFQNITRRLSRWAKRLTKLRCIVKDDVVFMPHQHLGPLSEADSFEKQPDFEGASYNLNPPLASSNIRDFDPEGRVTGRNLTRKDGDVSFTTGTNTSPLHEEYDQKSKTHLSYTSHSVRGKGQDRAVANAQISLSGYDDAVGSTSRSDKGSTGRVSPVFGDVDDGSRDVC